MDVVVYALCKKLIADSISSIGNIFTLQGTLPSESDLPMSGNESGDIYLVGPKADGSYDEFFWTGANKWEKMGTTGIDAGGYITAKTLYLGEDGSGTIENPASDTILAIVNAEIKKDYLSKDNMDIYIPTADYHPATKKYVDDIRTEIEKNNELEII